VIVRQLEDADLYDQEALAVETGVSKRTVRRKCEPVACDVATRAPLYDADAAGEVLGRVRPRPARTAAQQRMRRFAMA
jgi:hypothetical protein